MKKFLFILITLIILTVSLFIFWKSTITKSAQKPLIVPTAVQKLSRGEITVGTVPEEYATINSLVELLISAKSNDNIVGFDISLYYDQQYLKFIKAENLVNDQFDIFSSEKNNMLYISGIKKLTYKNKIDFKNTQIIKLQFQTIRKGKTKLVLLRHDNDMSESNLITETNSDILDKVSAPIIYINETINIKRNQRIVFNNDINITLTDFNIASESCRDCLTYAKLSVENKNEKKELFFKIGGLAGYLINKLSVNNYIFLLKEVKEDGIDLVIYEI